MCYQLGRDVGATLAQKYRQSPPGALGAVLLWAALHDRPLSWAGDPDHWRTTTLRPAC